MGEVVKGNFERGMSLGDRRALAFHKWLAMQEICTVEDMHAEMRRLKEIMPAPEDNQLEVFAENFSIEPNESVEVG